MPQRHVVELRQRDIAVQQHMVVPEHHRLLGCQRGLADGDMSCQHRRDAAVKALRSHLDCIGDHILKRFVNLSVRLAARSVGRQIIAALDPGQGDHLQRPITCFHDVGCKPVADMDIRNIESGEDFERGRLRDDLRRVMITDQQECRDAGVRQASDAPGELALVRLRGVTTLVCVPAEEHKVNFCVYRIVHQFVIGLEKIAKSGG